MGVKGGCVITKPRVILCTSVHLDLLTPTMFEDNPLEPSPFVFDPNDFSTFADFDIPSSSSSSRPSPAGPAIVEPQSDLDNNLWSKTIYSNPNRQYLSPSLPLLSIFLHSLTVALTLAVLAPLVASLLRLPSTRSSWPLLPLQRL
jgi:hypothetical protein